MRLAVVAVVLGLGACSKSSNAPSSSAEPQVPPLAVTSSAFAANAPIPAKYTCDGEDTSPPLAWSGEPSATKSFALVEVDPDAPDPKAPTRTWVHWVLYDIPPSTHAVAEGAKNAAGVQAGAHDGKNDFGNTGYGGPCPPVGQHRYFHDVYALDVVLGDQGALTKADLDDRMKGHVLAKGELVGTYQKASP